MLETSSNQASITVTQDGITSFASALLNAQTYEIFVDNQKVGVLNGYQTRQNCTLAAGLHSIYVRVYARSSVSITRVYGFSHTLKVDLSPGEHKSFSCGLVPGPPTRKVLLFGGLLVTILLAFGVYPIGQLPLRTRYVLVMIAALATVASSWLGYSSKPGSSIYLKES